MPAPSELTVVRGFRPSHQAPRVDTWEQRRRTGGPRGQRRPGCSDVKSVPPPAVVECPGCGEPMPLERRGYGKGHGRGDGGYRCGGCGFHFWLEGHMPQFDEPGKRGDWQTPAPSPQMIDMRRRVMNVWHLLYAEVDT